MKEKGTVMAKPLKCAACGTPFTQTPASIHNSELCWVCTHLALQAGRDAQDESRRLSSVFGSNSGSATANLASSGAQANLTVKDTPNKNFKASMRRASKECRAPCACRSLAVGPPNQACIRVR